MSWKVWAVIGMVSLLFLGGLAGVIGYLFVWPEIKLQRYYRFAEESYAAQRWDAAKSQYAYYLTGHQDDIETLEKYAECCLHTEDPYPVQLSSVGGAYIQIAKAAPANKEYQDRVMGFLRRHQMWSKLLEMAEFYLAREPDDAPLQYQRAVALERLGKNTGALAQYEEFAVKPPKAGESQPVAKYAQLIEANVVPRDVFGGMMRLYEKVDKESIGLSRLKDAEALFSEDPQFQVQRASCFLLLKDTDKAVEAIDKAVELSEGQPLDYDALVTASRVYYARFTELRKQQEADLQAVKEAYDRVEKYAESARDEDPERSEAYMTLAYLYHADDKDSEAIDVLESADEHARLLYPELNLTLAEFQIANFRFAEAKETRERYFKEGDSVYEYLQARELLIPGQQVAGSDPGTKPENTALQAAHILDAVVNANPAFVRAQLYQAIAYLQAYQQAATNGESAESVKALLESSRRALEFYVRNEPDDLQAQDLLARVSRGPVSLDAKIVEAGEMLADNATKASDMVNMASSLLSEGQGSPDASSELTSMTKQLLDRALEADPEDGETYALKAEFLAAHGRLDEAEATLDAGESRAKMPSKRTPELRALIALKRGDLDGAVALRDAAVAQESPGYDEALRWAYLFASEGHLQEGIDTLTAFQARAGKMDEASAPGGAELRVAWLEVEKAALATRFGDPDQALKLLESASKAAAGHPETQARLNDERAAYAERLLAMRDDAYMADADKLLSDLETSEPNSPVAKLLRLRQRMLVDRGNLEGVIQDAEALVNYTYPDSENKYPDAVRMGALILLQRMMSERGDFERARGYAEQAHDISPNSIQAELSLADASLAMNDYETARDMVKQVLSAEPDNVIALEYMVRACGGLRQLQLAEANLARLKQVLAANGAEDSAETLTALEGWLSRLSGNSGEAEKMLRKRIEAAPEDGAAVQELARLLAGRGDSAQAVRELRQYTTLKPDDAQAWTLMGQLLLQDGTASALLDAASAFSAALLVSDEYAPALRGLIEVSLRRGNTGPALGLCERYLAQRPDDDAILYVRALLMMRAGFRGDEVQQALAHVGRAIEIRPRPEYLELRSALLMIAGEYRDAVNDLLKLSESQSVDAAALDLALGEAYLNMKDFSKASDYLKLARGKVDDNDRALRNRLAKAYLVLAQAFFDEGDYDTADGYLSLAGEYKDSSDMALSQEIDDLGTKLGAAQTEAVK